MNLPLMIFIGRLLREWLKKNSLVARHLTLMDALGPASVSHNPLHVPVLDKDISGKVYQGLLSTAHISGDGNVSLINPVGVDLVGYQEQLRGYCKECKTAIDTLLFESLPKDAQDALREELGVTSTPSYGDNRGVMNEQLNKYGCGHLIKEAELVENEMKQAGAYSKQASALLTEIRSNKRQNILVDSPTSSVSSLESFDGDSHVTLLGDSHVTLSESALMLSCSGIDKSVALEKQKVNLMFL